MVKLGSCLSDGQLTWENSLSLDPRFADADLSLADGSPCIDAGSNDLVTG